MVDYDERLHAVYAEGRKLAPEGLQAWLREFAADAPAERPLAVLDLGCGIGRFTPALAEEFGGPVYGVEPSEQMRRQALQEAAHPQVTYLAGSAEAIPLPDDSVDLVLLFLTLHHWNDRQQGMTEVARVLRPGGVVLLRTQFADRMPDVHWYRYFPSARRVDAAMYLGLDEVRELVEQAGLVPDPEPRWVKATEARTLRASYERVKLRALSTFEHLPPDELEAGFAAFEKDAAAEPDREVPVVAAGLLVLRRPAG